MNKKIKVSLFAIMLLLAVRAEAKLFSFGAKGGVTVSSLSLNKNFKNNFSADNRTGFFVGPMVQLNIPLGFAVNGALLYSQENVKFESEFGSVNDKRRMIVVPVNIKWSIDLARIIGVYAVAGPDFTFNISGDGAIKDYVADNIAAAGGDPAKLINDSKSTTVGVNLGAGVILFKSLNVGFNYIIPLQESYKFSVEGVGEILSLKDKRWQISAAYLF